MKIIYLFIKLKLYPQNLALSIQKTAQFTLKTYPRRKINKEFILLCLWSMTMQNSYKLVHNSLFYQLKKFYKMSPLTMNKYFDCTVHLMFAHFIKETAKWFIPIYSSCDVKVCNYWGRFLLKWLIFKSLQY